MDPKEEYTEGFLEDQELLRRHREGDPKSFGQLFHKHRELAMRYARKYATSGEHAEDLVLEAFTRILASIKRGKGPTVSMGHYLVSTIRNIAITGTPHESNEFARDPSEVAQLYEHEHFSDRVKTSDWLTDAFNTLSDRSQRVMWFRAVENMPSREIASALGLSAATITREYQSAVGQLREQFVNFSGAEARDPLCREYLPLLRKFAKRQGASGAPEADEAFRLHVATCAHCSAVLSRLKAPERALLSIVFLAGLGGLAAESLASAPPAAASSLLAGLSVPVKVAMLAAPVMVVGVGLVFAGSLLPGSEASVPTTVTLGEIAEGGSSTLLQVGRCELTRESLDARSEAWRLSSDAAGCELQVSFSSLGAGDRSDVTLLDTTKAKELRALEVTQPGRYSVTVADGKASERIAVVVQR